MTRSTLTRPAFAVAAFAMLATAAVPSMASARGNANANTNGNAQTAMAEQAPKKICLSPTVTGDPTVTGSILAKRACRTKAEWEAKGVVFGSK